MILNLLDLALIVLAAVYIFVGSKRGFVISLLATARAFAAIPLSAYTGNTYAPIIYKNYARQLIVERLEDELSNSDGAKKLSDTLTQLTDKFSPLIGKSESDGILNALDSKTQAVYIADKILQPIAEEIIKIVLIVLTFLLFYVITGIIIKTAKKIRRKKNLPLHKTNSFFGGVLGFVKSTAAAVIICTALEYLSRLTSFESQYRAVADGSYIAGIMYEYVPWLTQ